MAKINALCYDYSELRGLIRARLGSEEKFSEMMGWSPVATSKKLNSINGWSQTDIITACNVLDIPYVEIPVYFFVVKVGE